LSCLKIGTKASLASDLCGGRNSSSPTKSSGLRLAATASPRTHLEPLSQRVRKKRLRLVVRRSRKMEGSGHPYGLTTIHACLPACPCLNACQCPMPVRAKSCREGGRSAAALAAVSTRARARVYIWGWPTIGRATVMCRRALLRTPALANGAPGAVKLLLK